MTFVVGPELPGFDFDVDRYGQEMVSNGDNLFYINTISNIFLKLECFSLVDCYWATMEQKLTETRERAVVSLIPNSFYTNCSLVENDILDDQ